MSNTSEFFGVNCFLWTVIITRPTSITFDHIKNRFRVKFDCCYGHDFLQVPHSMQSDSSTNFSPISSRALVRDRFGRMLFKNPIRIFAFFISLPSLISFMICSNSEMKLLNVPISLSLGAFLLDKPREIMGKTFRSM